MGLRSPDHNWPSGGYYLEFPSLGAYAKLRPGGSKYWVLAHQIEPLTPPKSQELVTWDAMPCTRDGKYRQEQHA